MCNSEVKAWGVDGENFKIFRWSQFVATSSSPLKGPECADEATVCHGRAETDGRGRDLIEPHELAETIENAAVNARVKHTRQREIINCFSMDYCFLFSFYWIGFAKEFKEQSSGAMRLCLRPLIYEISPELIWPE